MEIKGKPWEKYEETMKIQDLIDEKLFRNKRKDLEMTSFWRHDGLLSKTFGESRNSRGSSSRDTQQF